MQDSNEEIAPLDEAMCLQFWQRISREERLLSDLPAREAMEQINEWMEPLISDLAAEISGGDSGRRELILTAHGSVSRFQNLLTLLNSAPPLQWFEVSAFRRRCGEGFDMQMEDFELNTRDVLVNHTAENGQVAIELSFGKDIPMDYQEHARNMAFIMLDHMLGEYDFAVKVGPVDFRGPDQAGGGMPLDEFPAALDAFWVETLGRSGDFPDGEHQWTSLRVVRHDDDEELLVMRNDSANALVGRADLGWRLDVAMPVPSTDKLDVAHELEEAVTTSVLSTREGICSHIVLDGERVRRMSWYVANGSKARATAEALVRSKSLVDVTIGTEFDPAWGAYLQWAQ